MRRKERNQSLQIEMANASVGRDDRFYYEQTKTHKGLRNQVGQNNCFLNAVIQALWHLGPFRMQLREIIKLFASGNLVSSEFVDNSFLLSLCNLFTQYEFTEERVLPPDELRSLLGRLDDKFGFGKIADANEALETILQRIHDEFCPDRCKCLAHQIFSGNVLEQSACDLCGASTEPVLRDYYMLYFQAAEIIETSNSFNNSNNSNNNNNYSTPLFPRVQKVIKYVRSTFKRQHTEKLSQEEFRKNRFFGQLLHYSLTNLGKKSCPTNDDDSRPETYRCTGRTSLKTYSLEYPLALSCSFSWLDEMANIDSIRQFMELIPSTLYLYDIYNNKIEQEVDRKLPSYWRTNTSHPIYVEQNKDELNQKLLQFIDGPSYALQGLVCYYGKHYVSIFQAHGNEESFILFDDHRIRLIGSWIDVIEECVKSRYQPVLLFYELEKVEQESQQQQHYQQHYQQHVGEENEIILPRTLPDYKEFFDAIQSLESKSLLIPFLPPMKIENDEKKDNNNTNRDQNHIINNSENEDNEEIIEGDFHLPSYHDHKAYPKQESPRTQSIEGKGSKGGACSGSDSTMNSPSSIIQETKVMDEKMTSSTMTKSTISLLSSSAQAKYDEGNNSEAEDLIALKQSMDMPSSTCPATTAAIASLSDSKQQQQAPSTEQFKSNPPSLQVPNILDISNSNSSTSILELRRQQGLVDPVRASQQTSTLVVASPSNTTSLILPSDQNEHHHTYSTSELAGEDHKSKLIITLA
jgi:hypothetical protein